MLDYPYFTAITHKKHYTTVARTTQTQEITALVKNQDESDQCQKTR